MNQLEVRLLTKSFDSFQIVLKSIDFTVNKGEFLVVLGPSGCGKTTLLRIIAGLEKPDSGRIFIGGKDVTDSEPRQRDIAMVFQNYALYPHMTVYENLAFALKIRKTPKHKLKDIVESTAKLLGLSDYLHKKPKQLSGGQRQRVALGRAISRRPALFLFDEPLSNLDAELRLRMRSEILSLHNNIKGTFLYVTHDQIEAMSLADRIMIINKGLQIGPERPRLLYDYPPDTFTAEFLGNPGMNLLKGFTDESGNYIKIGNAQPFPHEKTLPTNNEIIYGFRPEDCQISQTGQIPIEVIGFEDTGKEYIIELSGPDNSKIFCLTEKKYNLGTKLYLKINKARFFDPKTSKALTS